MIQFTYGYDLETMAIGKYKSKVNTTVTAGKNVGFDTDGVTIIASDTPKFILAQDIDPTGPTYQERQMGVIQYKVKAGDPVLVVPYRKGGVIKTDNWTGSAPTAGTTEVEVTTGGAFQAYSAGTKIGIVRAVITDYAITSGTVYEIECY